MIDALSTNSTPAVCSNIESILSTPAYSSIVLELEITKPLSSAKILLAVKEAFQGAFPLLHRRDKLRTVLRTALRTSGMPDRYLPFHLDALNISLMPSQK